MNSEIKTVLIESDKTAKELEINYLSKIENIDLIKDFEDISKAYDYIRDNHPNLIIVDISNKTQQALETIAKISNNLKNTKIVVLSYEINSELVIQALRAGAREFLLKPLIEKDFQEAIEKIKDLIEGNINDGTKCKVISTFSNKGGLGKTSIATNVAVEIANLTKEKVALIDLNMQMGDITTFLNLNPVFDTSYVIRNLNRIDEASILSSLEKYKDTSLYVLSDPPNLEQAQNITAENITTLINILKDVFSYVVIDTTSSFDEKTIVALDNSDLIMLVSTINVPSVRNCQRCLDLFNQLGYPKDKVKLIVNRYMENDEIKADEFENALKHNIYFKIPNNYFTIIASINKGVPVSDINPASNIALSFRELASILSDNFTYDQKIKPQKRENNILNIFKNKK
ncbi:MAG: response regulator [Cyanobacteria bacterium SIG30]|nr:response regulator [Cyanobacteria bacterium SIG30]